MYESIISCFGSKITLKQNPLLIHFFTRPMHLHLSTVPFCTSTNRHNLQSPNYPHPLPSRLKPARTCEKAMRFDTYATRVTATASGPEL